MVDAEAVRRRLAEIDRRLGELRRIRDAGRAPFGDAEVRSQAERHLQVAIQAAIDIANHVVAEDSAETPEDYGAAFMMLIRMGVVDETLGEHLRGATGLRNILVHAYLDVDPDRLWEHLGRLEDLERFASAIEAYLS